VPAVWETAIACARPGATVNLFGGCPLRDTSITVNTEQLHYSINPEGVFHNTPGLYAPSAARESVISFELLIEHRL